jgi:hypothetical protein
MPDQFNLNHSVAHCWYATYSDADGSEIVVIEIRHIPKEGFLLHTNIRGMVYHIFESKFMYALGELLSSLPSDSSFLIPHEILINDSGTDRLIHLLERIFPYGTGQNVDVSYQLTLSFDGYEYSTSSSPDAMSGLEWLASQLGSATYFKVCGFCDFMFEDGMYGGTDNRHDLMYCFRDRPEVLDELRSMPRKSPSFPHLLLNVALQDLDLFHSCAAFKLARNFNSRIKNAENRYTSNEK